jgi:hypothetical protein
VKYEFEIKKVINGKTTTLLYLKSLVIDLNGEDFTIFNSSESDLFSSICQQHKVNIPEDGIINFNHDLTNEIKDKYTNYLLSEKDILERNEKLKFDSELTRKTNQEIIDIDKRIDRLELNIVEGKGIEKIQLAEISELNERKRKLIKLNSESTIGIKSKLVSLNFIYLYG